MSNGHDIPCNAARSTSTAPPTEEGGGVETFFRQQYDPLVTFVHRRGHLEHEAEDIAQESFARFLPYVRRKPQQAWRPMLYRIAVNVLNDRLRRSRTRQAHQHVPLDGLCVPADEPTVEEAAASNQREVQLRRALLDLPPQCRRVCLLKLVRGLDNTEVAKRCGISIRMVEKHVAHALLYLQDRFAREGAGT